VLKELSQEQIDYILTTGNLPPGVETCSPEEWWESLSDEDRKKVEETMALKEAIASGKVTVEYRDGKPIFHQRVMKNNK